METNIFKYKKANTKKLLKHGFVLNKDFYENSIPIMGGEFSLHVHIFPPNSVKTELLEVLTGEPYTLHLTSEVGTFVGQVREEYENALNNIAQNCFDDDIFKSKQTKELIKYIAEKYGDEPEFLWEKYPDCAIIRRAETKKWYFLIMPIPRSKLGFDTDEVVEVVNFHASADEIPDLLKQGNIYPGYHMNKKHWISVIMDGTLEIDEIYRLVDKSYKLAKK